ncbi:hypothetical protein P691DRAFT_575806 [Macrolepiota fuliginosa MF-IS2]|uniref:Uncharacterized protein n=1 Tax=Macrolepiota fuliginosa MF-IS2 TaxID=1400762 RepID=A0A9P5XGL4_9AGAR|nr:hypothetical protein P691DRAFT_575806 [Macrolepiota fuliginosa MF-IS2]
MSIVNLVRTVYFRNMGMLPFGILQGVSRSMPCNRVIFLVRESPTLGAGTSQTHPTSHYPGSSMETRSIRFWPLTIVRSRMNKDWIPWVRRAKLF